VVMVVVGVCLPARASFPLPNMVPEFRAEVVREVLLAALGDAISSAVSLRHICSNPKPLATDRSLALLTSVLLDSYDLDPSLFRALASRHSSNESDRIASTNGGGQDDGQPD
jgi:hypothetical protein